jgi:deoxynucleoside triphosphate triphosphohydrolase SAMHD1
MLILSTRFEDFYNGYIRVHDDQAEDALLRIACLIAGLPPHSSLSGIPELISSASVDSDKIDYVNRDARNCGVPVGVDVARIFLRSGIVRASREQIKALGLSDNPESEEYLFVVNSSGIDTIDEILQARTALYQRVYFHAVTRTAERLLGVALEANANASKPDQELTDALFLWSYRDGSILDRLINFKVQGAKCNAFRILNRRFPKKAYSFSPAIAGLQVPIDDVLPSATERSITTIKKQVNNTTIENYLRDEPLSKGEGSRLENAIKKEVSVIIASLLDCGVLHSPDAKDLIPDGDAPGCLLIVGAAHEKQRHHSPIIFQNDRLLQVKDYTNAREQQVAFELLKETGFVLCEEEWRPFVFFASRLVLALLGNQIVEAPLELRQGRKSGGKYITESIRYMTRFLPDYSISVLRSGHSARSIMKVARALTDAKYFDDKPWLGPPVLIEDKKIRRIAEKLQHFDGFHSWRVTPRSAATFISQFPPSLRLSMTEIMETKLEVINSKTAVELLAPMLEEMPEQVDVVAFTPSSGSEIRNWLSKELGSDNVRIQFPTDLKGALKVGTTNTIVFVDDNVSSTVQARAQFLSLMGVPRCQWPEECRAEDNVFSEIDSELITPFRERNIYLFVCAGVAGAEKKLQDCLQHYGYTNFRKLRVAKPIDNSVNWDPELKAFLTSVGQEVLAWGWFRKPFGDLMPTEKADCEEHAFGYANAGGLVTTTLNVPTSTVTALWHPGLYRGQPWMPLVLRTNKLQHLVVA